jgi:DNA-binding NarL/FixJ family response regulator
MKILVVDDHPLILEALHHVLRQLASQVSVFDARNGADAKALLAAHADAGLLLLDLGLPGVDGFTLLADVRQAHPDIPVVVLSGSDDREDIVRAIDLGAMGYIPKRSSNDIMLQALRLVLSGGVYLPPNALALRDEAPPQPRNASAARTTPQDLGLTSRQAQVLALILQGKPNKDICRELNLAEGTVKIHVAAILRALNVASRTQAVIEASRLGLRLENLLAAPATGARLA